MNPECDCYPYGITPDTFEGPQRDCPVHGESSEPHNPESLTGCVPLNDSGTAFACFLSEDV